MLDPTKGKERAVKGVSIKKSARRRALQVSRITKGAASQKKGARTKDHARRKKVGTCPKEVERRCALRLFASGRP